jgi:hypothetical protein
LRWTVHGAERYLPLEKAFAVEDGCSYLVTDTTRPKLMAELDADEFAVARLDGRIVLNDLEAFVRDRRIDLDRTEHAEQLKAKFACDCLRAELAIDELIRFCRVDPRLPASEGKRFQAGGEPLGIDPDMDREAVVARLEALRDRHPLADLAFYAYRDLNRTEPEPFLLAALERNPVCRAGAGAAADDEVLARLRAMPDESIYDEPGRLAQPDEVWNYGRGDGAEKALLFAALLRQRHPEDVFRVAVTPERVTVEGRRSRVEFASSKRLRPQTWLIEEGDR